MSTSTFRAQRSAASLKLSRVTNRGANWIVFPRSTKRGLIEAAESFRCPQRRQRHFPRSTKRGLIEASAQESMNQPQQTAFRAQRSAASLKPQQFATLDIRLVGFPRSTKRGLIEALPSLPKRLAGWSFPRSTKRGLIEATLVPSTAFRCEPFRAQRSAASLKLMTSVEGQELVQAFRAQRSAASLKLDLMSCEVDDVIPFRAQRSAASLKRVRVPGFTVSGLLSALNEARPH